MKCAYFMCNKKDVSMFRFPSGDPRRLAIWLNNCGNMTITHLKPEELRNKYLCESHFDKKFFSKTTQGQRMRLLKTAEPIHYKDFHTSSDVAPDFSSPSTSKGGDPSPLRVLPPKKTYKSSQRQSQDNADKNGKGIDNLPAETNQHMELEINASHSVTTLQPSLDPKTKTKATGKRLKQRKHSKSNKAIAAPSSAGSGARDQEPYLILTDEQPGAQAVKVEVDNETQPEIDTNNESTVSCYEHDGDQGNDETVQHCGEVNDDTQHYDDGSSTIPPFQIKWEPADIAGPFAGTTNCEQIQSEIMDFKVEPKEMNFDERITAKRRKIAESSSTIPPFQIKLEPADVAGPFAETTNCEQIQSEIMDFKVEPNVMDFDERITAKRTEIAENSTPIIQNVKSESALIVEPFEETTNCDEIEIKDEPIEMDFDEGITLNAKRRRND